MVHSAIKLNASPHPSEIWSCSQKVSHKLPLGLPGRNRIMCGARFSLWAASREVETCENAPGAPFGLSWLGLE